MSTFSKVPALHGMLTKFAASTPGLDREKGTSDSAAPAAVTSACCNGGDAPETAPTAPAAQSAGCSVAAAGKERFSGGGDGAALGVLEGSSSGAGSITPCCK